MSNKGHRGSFLGFTYNNIHSSTLGITRVSSGKRYTDNLVPSLKDVTSDIVGATGTVYFGTYYTKRVLSVPFAFDGLTEAQIKQIQTLWHDKAIHNLVFDEWPYKVYSAKVTSIMSLKHVMFTDKDGTDHYKGEGNIAFTCYFPFARSRYSWREDYTLENIPEWRADDEFDGIVHLEENGNLLYDFGANPPAFGRLVGERSEFDWVTPQSLLQTELMDAPDATVNSEIIMHHYSDSPYVNYSDWIDSSRIPSSSNYGNYNNGRIILYNAGDVPMPTQWWYRVSDTPQSIFFRCDYEAKMSIANLRQSHMISPTGAGADYYINIDMPRATIQGYDRDLRPTGRLYNRYITSGNFFGIPVGAHVIEVAEPVDLKFNYLYL